MNRPPSSKSEVADVVRGELRRAAHRATESFETLEGLAVLGLEATTSIFSETSAVELRRLAQQLRALAMHGAQSLAEVERVTGLLETLAKVREARD